MSKKLEHWLRVEVLRFDGKHNQGEPFLTFVNAIQEAWSEVPQDQRKNAEFRIGLDGIVTAWYYREENEEDKRDLAEYERLKEKFERVTRKL